MDTQKLLEQSLRIRYEAFSNFASAVSKATTMEAVAESIAIHAKYILDVYCIRYYYSFAEFSFCFEVFRGSVKIHEDYHQTKACDFESPLLEKGIPVYYPNCKCIENEGLQNGIFSQPAINSIYGLPLNLPENQQLVMLVASKEPDCYSEPDFRFIKLMAELAANKLAQLLLIKRVENKNSELEEVNEELSCLNEEIKNLNLHLEEEVEKRTLQLTAANQELNTIFYRTSHDFRGPLTSILGLTNLAKHITTDPSVLQLFNHCENTVNKLDKMLQKLKLLSYIDDEDVGPKEIFPFLLMEKTILKYNHAVNKKDLSISLTFPKEVNFVTEETAFLAIVENLIENSIVFSPSHSCIHINFELSESIAVLEIIDEGEGIPEVYLDRIFQMYFKASESSEGNGLGLYVVKRLIEKLKGQIEIESVVGKGTKVRVLFFPVDSKIKDYSA